jgi:hypothetical protein
LAAANPATPTPGTFEKTSAEKAPEPTEPAANPATPTPGVNAEAVSAESAGEAGLCPEVITPAMAAAANVSLCEAWQQQIEAALDQGLSAKRVHEDLVREHRFAGSYQSVKRFVRKLEQAAAVPYRRMEFAPGEQPKVGVRERAHFTVWRRRTTLRGDKTASFRAKDV